MTPSNEPPRCIHCERTSHEAPLVHMQFQDNDLWICTQHLPILIHSPAELAQKLPGLAQMGPSEGHGH